MLIEVILQNKRSVSLNVNYIIHVEPNENGGCNIFINGGNSWYTEEQYETIVGRIRSVYRSYMKNP